MPVNEPLIADEEADTITSTNQSFCSNIYSKFPGWQFQLAALGLIPTACAIVYDTMNDEEMFDFQHNLAASLLLLSGGIMTLPYITQQICSTSLFNSASTSKNALSGIETNYQDIVYIIKLNELSKQDETTTFCLAIKEKNQSEFTLDSDVTFVINNSELKDISAITDWQSLISKISEPNQEAITSESSDAKGNKDIYTEKLDSLTKLCQTNNPIISNNA